MKTIVTEMMGTVTIPPAASLKFIEDALRAADDAGAVLKVGDQTFRLTMRGDSLDVSPEPPHIPE